MARLPCGQTLARKLEAERVLSSSAPPMEARSTKRLHKSNPRSWVSRFGIKGIQVGKARVLMSGMQGGCQHVGGTDNVWVLRGFWVVVHRSKRIETLAPLLVVRKRQRDDRSGSYLVLNGLEEMETAGKHGTAKIEARRGRSQTPHVPTAKAEFRQRIAAFGTHPEAAEFLVVQKNLRWAGSVRAVLEVVHTPI